jgi:hypothetical protein
MSKQENTSWAKDEMSFQGDSRGRLISFALVQIEETVTSAALKNERMMVQIR